MQELFVAYEQALKLRELGFNELCFASIDKFSGCAYIPSKGGKYRNDEGPTLACPLYQQAFDWFREKHNLFSTIAISGVDDYQIYIHDLNNRNKLYFKDMKEGHFTKVINFCYKNKDDIYEEARQVLLNKLIEIVENKKSN